MTDYSKPAVRHAWAETAGSGNISDPGDAYAEAGWPLSSTPPQRQYFNWLENYVTVGIRYYCQVGVPDYDAAENYRANSIARGPDGLVYQSKIANNIGNVPASSPTRWGPVTAATPANGDSSHAVATTAFVSNNYLAKGSTFGAIGGTLANSQLVAGNVTQFQGALQIGGGQVTSAVAKANTLNLSGNYATFNWSGQSGQPSWLLGSNDGVNFYVYNPSNFNVNLLQGYAPTSSPAASTIMLRDASGYAYATYFNSSSGNNENPGISQVVVTNGDNFMRKAGLAYFLQQAMLSGAVTLQADPGGTPANGTPGTIVWYY